MLCCNKLFILFYISYSENCLIIIIIIFLLPKQKLRYIKDLKWNKIFFKVVWNNDLFLRVAAKSLSNIYIIYKIKH